MFFYLILLFCPICSRNSFARFTISSKLAFSSSADSCALDIKEAKSLFIVSCASSSRALINSDNNFLYDGGYIEFLKILVSSGVIWLIVSGLFAFEISLSLAKSIKFHDPIIVKGCSNALSIGALFDCSYSSS